MPLYLSPKHGLNPSIEKCFFCNGDKSVILFGRIPDGNGGEKEAPRAAVLNQEPCDKCKGLMDQGIILISVDEEKTGEDTNNPYRTGGWVVVKEEAIVRAFSDTPVLEYILKKRVAFLTDEAWDRLGLPRGPVEGVPS